MANMMTVTTDGFKKLEAELSFLVNTKREEVKEAIAVARSFGDLSENSEYDEAKNEQAKVEARIAELEEILKNVTVIDESSISTDVVGLGTKVKIRDVEYGDEEDLSIVGSNEAESLAGKISDLSPLGVALIGKKIGDVVTVEAPSGSYEVEILDISLDK
ncbi:MAG: transcription elongation factor GreA [Ruminococcaceae bacterium]|nr:transcription elongation factor GreA [Oscillospiraceae bacterium]